MQELVLRLVWGAGDLRGFDSAVMAEYSFRGSLVRNIEAFSR